MAKIMFLFPYPMGEAPSQRFRFEQYLSTLNKQHSFETHAFIDHATWKSLYDSGRFFFKARKILICFLKRAFLLSKIRNFDFVFIHREAAHIGPPIFEWIIAKLLRKKIIYDFDDAIWLPNYSETNASFQRLKAYWKVKHIVRWSHKVCAGNSFLADFARKYNRNTEVFPTTIDLKNQHNLKTVHQKEKVTIGWTGTHTTMHYLEEIFPVLDKLILKHDFTFLIISNQAPETKRSYIEYLPWNKETEMTDLIRISIGVMPLKEDIWSSGKCGFKALQYMACEIPTVLSPVGVNKEIIEHEVNGSFAQSAEEWEKTLSLLLSRVELRKKWGQAGRKTIVERFSTDSKTKQFLQLFES